MKQKYYYTIIIIVFLVLIFISGCAKIEVSRDSQENKEEMLADCNKISENKTCSSWNKHSSGDEDVCTWYFEWTRCYSDIANTLNDASVCEGLPEEVGYRVYPRDRCYFLLATSLNDPKICKEMGTLPTQCYVNISINLNDNSICDNAIYINTLYPEGESIKNNCYEQLAIKTNNIELCDKAEESFRDNCYDFLKK